MMHVESHLLGGYGGMFPQGNFHALRLLLVAFWAAKNKKVLSLNSGGVGGKESQGPPSLYDPLHRFHYPHCFLSFLKTGLFNTAEG